MTLKKMVIFSGLGINKEFRCVSTNILIFQCQPIQWRLKDKDVFLMRAMLSESVIETQKARPFLKWAGGKTQLLDEIDIRLPIKEIESGQIDSYIEPFVGGGALFFHVARKYQQMY